ncbi:MAG TPA: glycosyltransferase family 87 protein [Acidobacteriaceae bacterium]|nr:glycosyltransferase family 87 protein [Acidobacteriaceae bacterium]
MSSSFGKKSFLRWPSRILGPRPGLFEINLACWGLFAGFVIVPLIAGFWIKWRAGAGMNFLLPCDFVYFYGIGHIALNYPLAELYDYPLVLRITDQVYPLHDLVWGPNPYPPYVGLLFSIYARVSFLQAYLLWVITSLGLYLTGVMAILKGVFPSEPLKRSLVICFALGFYPFFICTLKNGQLSTLAVFAVGLAILQESKGRPFLGGLALSLLVYKPTLLLLLGPMLLLTRRFRMLGGFVTGFAVLAGITTASGGAGIWLTYLHSLSFFRQFIASQGKSVLQLWEYVDFNSFSYSIPAGRSAPFLAVLLCISCASVVALAAFLWKSARGGRNMQDLAWAATLTWTLLLNLYVPVWDSILVVLALLLTLRALNGIGWQGYTQWVIVIALLMLAATWNVIASTNRHGSQLMMLLLFALGILELFLLYSFARDSSPGHQSVEAATPEALP